MVHYGNNDFMRDYSSKPLLSFLTLDNGIQNFFLSIFSHSICCSTFTIGIHLSTSPYSHDFPHLFFLPLQYFSEGHSNLIWGYFLVFHRFHRTYSIFFCWGKTIGVHFVPSADLHTIRIFNPIKEFSFLRSEFSTCIPCTFFEVIRCPLQSCQHIFRLNHW